MLLVCGICTVGVIVSGAHGAGSSTSDHPTSHDPSSRAATAGPQPSSEAPAAATTSAVVPRSSTKTTIVVPNGVGMDYQSAQDLWRAAGLHVAPAIDGTGAHRLPVIDSNWVVLSQDPKAGAVVERGTFITATVKKYTDS